jgi:excinuclease UvrABC nuclease subunit
MDTARIEQLVIPETGQRMSGDALRDVRKPGVYVLMLGQTVLYVGLGKRIMGRLGGCHAQEDKAIAECDEVRLHPCVSEAAAEELETILIEIFQPRFNVRKRNVKGIAARTVAKMTADVKVKAVREGIRIEAETMGGRIKPKSWVAEQLERRAA